MQFGAQPALLDKRRVNKNLKKNEILKVLQLGIDMFI